MHGRQPTRKAAAIIKYPRYLRPASIIIRRLRNGRVISGRHSRLIGRGKKVRNWVSTRTDMKSQLYTSASMNRNRYLGCWFTKYSWMYCLSRRRGVRFHSKKRPTTWEA